MSRKADKKTGPSRREWQKLDAAFADVRQRLTLRQQKGVFPQALLLTGYEGIGKARFAAAIAASFYCATGDGCGHCHACKQVIDGREFDLLWIETEETSLKIADAQQLIEHTAYSALSGTQGRSPARVVVVVDADKFNPQALNSLLKTLEEPNPFSYVIFTTSREKLILETVLSRMVKVTLPRPKNSAESLGNQEIDPDEQALWTKLMSPGLQAPVAVAIAETLIKNYGYSAAELAQRAEAFLNGYYKEILKISAPYSFEGMQKRRDNLRLIRELALQKKITLNAQLSAEGLAGI